MDGYTSSALFIKFMQFINCPIDILIDEGKTHGLTDNIMSKILDEQYTLVIIPDAGSNDIKQHKVLLDNNIDFLVLDHHEVLPETVDNINKNDKGIVINNQLLDINKNFTGVGMVYFFLKHVNYFENIDFDLDKHLDLVALGHIADVSDVSDKEIRYYVTKGLNETTNIFVKSVMKRKGLSEMTGRDASFSIISMMNAVTRVGTIEEKHRMFNALVSDSEETSTIEVRKKNKKTGKFDKIPTEMLNQEVVAKECEAIKAKQDKIVKEAMTKVDIIYNKDVIIGTISDNYPSSINGLVAMKLSSKERKPVMIGKESKNSLSGSLRAPDGLDFKGVLTESGLFDFVSGHKSAAGWKIDNEKLDDLYQYLDNFPFDSKNSVYYVDKVYSKPDDSDIYMVEINKQVFGGAVEFPELGYENIKFNNKCINIRGSVTTFFDNNVSFVLFNSPNDIKEQIEDHMKNNNITMNIIGNPRINKFGNKEIPQIVIEHFEFVENYDIIEEEPANSWGIDF
jgi:single-stranded-DNA-specific exonuclease